MFWLAGNEGLLANASTSPSLHAGLRTRLSGDGWDDHDDDTAQNWVRISADDIDDLGTAGVIKTILDTFATAESEGDPVYLSVDIDVLDPGRCILSEASDRDALKAAGEVIIRNLLLTRTQPSHQGRELRSRAAGPRASLSEFSGA